MDLNTIWFILISGLFVGFFVLEGFDFGVGIVMPFLGKDARARETGIKTIEPFWDGNEVWLITAGASMFAAFPHWYATLFSGLFIPLVLLLMALILRGVAIEFRNKHEGRRWQAWWQSLFFVGSLVPALLWGVALSNMVRGLPIDAEMTYVGGFWNLLNPFSLVGGLAFVLLFALHGALFISLRTLGSVKQQAERIAVRTGIPALVLLAAFVAYAGFETDLFKQGGLSGYVAAGAGALALGAVILAWKGRFGWAFALTFAAIAGVTSGLFMTLYPRVLISSLDSAWNLTVYNAASSPYTLRIMTIISALFLPVILLYEGWTYWVFRKRIEGEPVAY
ncbi:MAG TPA: cytochrome d ubiquinol oxidase subunit II [Verrucomicrobia bacterium]|nr:MAG: cytochrome d ubiquinol oxidase subunit II [Lentisphaerae bacterium GWF2_57_35]HBA85313.1 cytochrome d ubiquinol oxidase subunit II [Verrucomicrobiota bacterium]